jgi:hypothetical protein
MDSFGFPSDNFKKMFKEFLPLLLMKSGIFSSLSGYRIVLSFSLGSLVLPVSLYKTLLFKFVQDGIERTMIKFKQAITFFFQLKCQLVSMLFSG